MGSLVLTVESDQSSDDANHAVLRITGTRIVNPVT